MAADADRAKTQFRGNRARPRAAELLFTAIQYPAKAASFTEPDWDLLLRIARREGLLARIAIQLEQAGVSDRIPQQVLDHMIAARAIATNDARMILWEVDRIQFALRSIETPILLLKGAAYLLADLPLAQGRLVSDVDILVPESSLDKVEAALIAAGWGPLKLNP